MTLQRMQSTTVANTVESSHMIIIFKTQFFITCSDMKYFNKSKCFKNLILQILLLI